MHMICKRIKQAFGELGGMVISTHTPREGNSAADGHANEALNAQGPMANGVLAITDPDLFPNVKEIKSWFKKTSEDPGIPPLPRSRVPGIFVW